MERRSSTLSELKGHLWATGKTDEGPEDPLKAAEDAMGQVFSSIFTTPSLIIDSKEWFAVTAFPLFAGTFGSIASALNICALVQSWRCEVTEGYVDVKSISDPSWYV
jgi:hypothetical protein